MLMYDDADVAFLTGQVPASGASFPPPSGPAAAAPAVTSSFKFGRMFDLKDTTQGKAAELKVAGLIELGTAMDTNPPPVGPASESVIPAGYTYFGQFIAHEVSFDGKSAELPTEEVNLDELLQLRSPMIDLDSLYGQGPEGEKDNRLYEADNIRMKVGITLPSNWLKCPPLDLPRAGTEAIRPRQALIGDPRNDENLPIAQTHVAFLNFHNKVADGLDAENTGKNLAPATFADVRREVVRHFQWIILKHYLPRLIDEDVLLAVLTRMRKNDGKLEFFNPKAGIGLYMPVEFSGAAFRFGHSMVRDSYEWNFFHNSTIEFPGPPSVSELFLQTGMEETGGDLGGKTNLLSDWIIDWERFYEFPKPGPAFNLAKKIDINFDFRFATMKGVPQPPATAAKYYALPVRNLLRGFALRLPSGQTVAKALSLKDDECLKSEQIAEGPHAEVLKAHSFHEDTPLWYYILREAETLGKGNQLGPVGSRLLAETFVGLVRHSDDSILDPVDETKDWKPSLGNRAPNAFDMPDLLEFTGIVNPTG